MNNACLTCGTDTKTKFCSRSCAATHNNKGRVRSEESRKKTSQSLTKAYAAEIKSASKPIALHKPRDGRAWTPVRRIDCSFCGNAFWSTRSVNSHDFRVICSKRCRSALRSRIAIETGQLGPRSGPYTKVKQANCSECGARFWSRDHNRNGYWSRLCSDACLIKKKTANATGIKRKTYNGQAFDSGWEVEVATWLDSNQIRWVKPKSIAWIDRTGKTRKYFADFYLPDYGLYLDPKNKLVISRQAEKLAAVTKLVDLVYGDPQHIIKEVGSR